MTYRKPQEQYGGILSLSHTHFNVWRRGFHFLPLCWIWLQFNLWKTKKPLWPRKIHPPFNQCSVEQIMGELSFLDEQDNIELCLRTAFNEQYVESVTVMRTDTVLYYYYYVTWYYFKLCYQALCDALIISAMPADWSKTDSNLVDLRFVTKRG